VRRLQAHSSGCCVQSCSKSCPLAAERIPCLLDRRPDFVAAQAAGVPQRSHWLHYPVCWSTSVREACRGHPNCLDRQEERCGRHLQTSPEHRHHAALSRPAGPFHRYRWHATSTGSHSPNLLRHATFADTSVCYAEAGPDAWWQGSVRAGHSLSWQQLSQMRW
jgi:hypothetical protein